MGSLAGQIRNVPLHNRLLNSEMAEMSSSHCLEYGVKTMKGVSIAFLEREQGAGWSNCWCQMQGKTLFLRGGLAPVHRV
jgi:hypothetical protein